MISFRLPGESGNNIWLVPRDVPRDNGVCRWQTWVRSSCVTELAPCTIIPGTIVPVWGCTGTVTALAMAPLVQQELDIA